MNRARASSEAGISAAETIIVLVLIAVVLSLGLSTIRSSRSTGALMAGISAAQAYGAAIDSFAREHDGRLPGALGTGDWPGGTAAASGPQSRTIGGNQRYLRHVPEAVQDGRVSFTDTAAPARISYRVVNGGRGYELRVTARNRTPCVVIGGSVPSPTAMACSKR